MTRKKEKRINVVAYLSTDGNMYSAPGKEKRQLRYIKEYANAHNIHIVKIMNRDIANNRDVIKNFKTIASLVAADNGVDGVIVAKTAAVSVSTADAYYKIGLIVEAGGIFISVDEGRLALRKEA